MTTPALTAARLVALRDLRLAFRKPSQVIQPLMFFMIVATLFPLTLTPEMSRLRDAAPGVLWIGALLSSLLALEFLFRDDAVDGTLEQFALSGQSLTWMLFAKTCTHWLLTGLPLAVSAPIAAAALGVSVEAMGGVVASLALGSFAMSLVGAIGAGLGRNRLVLPVEPMNIGMGLEVCPDHAAHRVHRHAERSRRDRRGQRQRKSREQPVRAGFREQHPCQRLSR